MAPDTCGAAALTLEEVQKNVAAAFTQAIKSKWKLNRVQAQRVNTVGGIYYAHLCVNGERGWSCGSVCNTWTLQQGGLSNYTATCTAKNHDKDGGCPNENERNGKCDERKQEDDCCVCDMVMDPPATTGVAAAYVHVWSCECVLVCVRVCTPLRCTCLLRSTGQLAPCAHPSSPRRGTAPFAAERTQCCQPCRLGYSRAWGPLNYLNGRGGGGGACSGRRCDNQRDVPCTCALCSS